MWINLNEFTIGRESILCSSLCLSAWLPDCLIVCLPLFYLHSVNMCCLPFFLSTLLLSPFLTFYYFYFVSFRSLFFWKPFNSSVFPSKFEAGSEDYAVFVLEFWRKTLRSETLLSLHSFCRHFPSSDQKILYVFFAVSLTLI